MTNSDLVQTRRIGMGHSDVSDNHIYSDGFGPCLFFLLDFTYKNRAKCYLHHYSFSFDESNMPLAEVLRECLNMMLENLKKYLDLKTILPVSPGETIISDLRLIIGGGDVNEALLIKNAFSLLNSNNADTLIEYFNDAEISYLYEQLMHRTIILKSVFRILSEREEARGKFL